MTDDNVRQLRPGPFAGDDLDLTDAQLVDEAVRVDEARALLANAPGTPDAAAVLASPGTALARRRFDTLAGLPVAILDELPGGADLLLAYTVDPTPPPRKAHG